MICSKDKCIGCYACINICPQKCIKMEEDELGVVYPRIDQNSCINCDLCKKICPGNNTIKFNTIKKCYAGWALDKKERNTSSSGGIASVLSRYIIGKKGVVYGAAIDNDTLETRHIRVDNESELYKLKKSKYVHSIIGLNYKQVKVDLEENKLVLFVGTP